MRSLIVQRILDETPQEIKDKVRTETYKLLNKMPRPLFIEPENMLHLGFELISDKDGYLKYQNNATILYNQDYNKHHPEPKGKVILYFNTNYTETSIYLQIRQDGDTRTVFNGVCDTALFLKLLLESVR